MKIESSVLHKFIKNIMLSGSAYIEQGVLDFTDNGVDVMINTLNRSILISAKLNSESFSDYEAIGKIGVMSFDIFSKMLSRHTGAITIELSKSKDKLIFRDSKNKSELSLPELDYINVFDSSESFTKAKKFKWNDDVDLDLVDVKKFISDLSIIKSDEVRIVTKKGGILFTSGEIDGITTALKNTKIKGGVDIVFTSSFADFVKSITDIDTINIKLQNAVPMLCSLSTEMFAIDYLIAPEDK